MAVRRRKVDPDAAALTAAGLEVAERDDGTGGTEFHVSGNTHPHRHALRKAGGAWHRLKQVWIFDGDDPAPGIARELAAGRGGLSDTEPPPPGDRPHYHGHRRRLRERFMDGDVGGLPDYELLELLLFYAIPRVDVKPLAKALLERFGSLGAVLAADPERLGEVDRVTHQTAVLLRAVRDASLRLAREEIAARPVLSSWKALIDYLRTAMAHETRECFRVVFLNRRNEVIADEVQGMGSIDHTPAYPREVVKRALELGATALVLAHNHPSGDATPSRGDIETTKEIGTAAAALGIVLHDHVIVTRKSYASFKEMGLL